MKQIEETKNNKKNNNIIFVFGFIVIYFMFILFVNNSFMTNFKPTIINVGGEEKRIEKRELRDIFKFNTPPYIALASSGGGKTTLAIDLIYTFAKECTNVYYITATKETLTDDSISLIPKSFRREPTYDNIQNVWNEIISQTDAANAPPEKLTEIIIKLYGEETAKIINDKIEEQKKIINERNTKIYKNAGMSKSLIIENVKNDILAFVYEIKRRIILFAFNDFPNIDEKLTVEQTTIINALISERPKTLLIMDDITSELETLKHDTNKVYVKDNWLSKSKAFHSLLNDILTRARHYNCIVVFFIHTIEIFDEKDRISNILMFDNVVSQKLLNLKSFDQKTKSTIRLAADKLFGNEDYKHMFLFISRSNNSICVGKARLHNSNDKLELSPLTEKFIELYNNILSGFKATPQIEDNNDETEGEYYEEETEEQNDIL